MYAPTFRGRGRAKHGTTALDGRRLRERLPADCALVLKSHPNLDPATQPHDGFDIVADPKSDMNDWLALADVFVTDYSSSVFEWAILHRPLVLIPDDLEAYERGSRDLPRLPDPDDRDAGPGCRGGRRRDPRATTSTSTGYDRFIAATIDACDGHASERFVERFLPRHERVGRR